MDGMTANNLNHFSHVLTGFIGSESFLDQVSEEISKLKLSNPSLKYHCDPVLGDNGVFYVPESLVEVYKQKIMPVADVITPNDFEVRQLTGEPCDSLENTLLAIDKLHKMGPKTVVLSSILLDRNSENDLTLICSCRLDDGSFSRARVDFPRIDARFTGTGDLFSALFLAWCVIYGENKCGEACEKAVSTIHEILKKTVLSNNEYLANGHHEKESSNQIKPPPELKLIASKSVIEKGDVIFKFEPLN